MKEAIRKGYIVETDKGKIGMVTYKKDNDNIGINFGHLPIIQYTNKDKTPEEIKEIMYMMGCDDLIQKHEIIKIISK